MPRHPQKLAILVGIGCRAKRPYGTLSARVRSGSCTILEWERRLPNVTL